MARNAVGAVKACATRCGVDTGTYLALVAQGLKWCGGCDRWLMLDSFGEDRSRGDGKASRCVRCRRVMSGPSREERRAQELLGMSWCKECGDWFSGRRGGLCREHANRAYRRAYANNPRAIRARTSARRRRLKEPIPPTWVDEERASLGGLCAYGCGRPATTNDHIVPVARGGDNNPWNLAPACVACNSSKGADDPAEWIIRGLWSEYAANYWCDKIALAVSVGANIEGYTVERVS